MIIVLLLFFQSICLYCQRLVLYIHDRWINPKNVRLLKEVSETKITAGHSRHKLFATDCPDKCHEKRVKKRYTTTTSGSGADVLAETCRFCVNSPQGYCRHHFHLQELELQKQQSTWNPLVGGADKTKQEYLQLRKINRELKRNLKNRYSAQQQQNRQLQFQKQQRLQQQQEQHGIFTTASHDSLQSVATGNTCDYSNSSSGYQSLNSDNLKHMPHSREIETRSPSCSDINCAYSQLSNQTTTNTRSTMLTSYL